ncbi:hypothetical protein F2Q69_00020676 [Brassica cretica]|uniref:Uncharacterized protein n=1 Tax=Brassica cretica TaxID=69181 RepID=A0A8S9QHG6_BRACR|nr:hypothetical protein F2Q69_00020676 [Brassica cretica]
MQRSNGRSDTDASTTANGTESATEKYILGSKIEEIHLGEGRSHDGKFLKDLAEGSQENCILSIRVEFAKLGSKSRMILILFEFCLKRNLVSSCIYNDDDSVIDRCTDVCDHVSVSKHRALQYQTFRHCRCLD